MTKKMLKKTRLAKVLQAEQNYDEKIGSEKIKKKKLKVEIEETGTEKKLQNTEMNGRGRVCSKII